MAVIRRAGWWGPLGLAAAFWAVAAFLAASTSILYGGLPASVFGLATGVILLGGYLAWNGLVRGRRLPVSGLEVPLALLAGGVVLSLVFSPNPRLGLDRTAWLLFDILLFYALLDLLRRGPAGGLIRQALLWVSGFLLLAALLETYAWYLNWWDAVGSRAILPPVQYRFASLAVHSSFFMMIVNLCAPLAASAFLWGRGRAGRVGGALWLVMYVMAAPFSSSRAGWLGAAAWMALLLVLWALEPENRARLLGWFHRAPKTLLGAGGLVLLVAAAGGFWLFKTYGLHPTHGSGGLNRDVMWNGALTMWKSSPWVGVGPGRPGLEYLRLAKDSPFAWWPWHAHSTTLQILAESGLAGLLPFVALVALAAYRLVRACQKATGEARSYARAGLAALAGIAVQCIFDDVTIAPFAAGILVYQAAAVLQSDQASRVWGKISLGWLLLPGAAAAGFAAFALWAAQPYYQAILPARAGEWQSAARLVEVSHQRDPRQPAYSSQAGLLWSLEWEKTGSSQALDQARGSLRASLAIEPDFSLLWANLALLDWQAGQPGQALQHMQRAIAITPTEPTYYLNYGWLLEQAGRSAEASKQYAAALEMAPVTIKHPFWKSTAVRQAGANEMGAESPLVSGTYWGKAQADIESGDYQSARLNLALSGIYNESPVAAASVRASLAMRQGGSLQTSASLAEMVATIISEERKFNAYSFYFGLPSLTPAVVPGYLQTQPDAGQFALLDRFYHDQAAAGNCDDAAVTWNILQKETSAGALPPGGYQPAPACP